MHIVFPNISVCLIQGMLRIVEWSSRKIGASEHIKEGNKRNVKKKEEKRKKIAQVKDVFKKAKRNISEER